MSSPAPSARAQAFVASDAKFEAFVNAALIDELTHLFRELPLAEADFNRLGTLVNHASELAKTLVPHHALLIADVLGRWCDEHSVADVHLQSVLGRLAVAKKTAESITPSPELLQLLTQPQPQPR